MRGVRSGYSALLRTFYRQGALPGEMPGTGQRLRNVLASTTIIGAAFGMSACSPVPSLPPAPPEPAPGSGYASELTPYRIPVGDVLDVRLMLNPELNEEITVRPDGHISTTVVKDELAYGRTVPD